jgi:hypothetical protein
VTVKGCEVFSYVGNAKNVGHSDANSVFDKTHGRARSKNRASKSRFIELIGKRKKLYFDKLLKISVSSSGPTFALASLIAVLTNCQVNRIYKQYELLMGTQKEMKRSQVG